MHYTNDTGYVTMDLKTLINPPNGDSAFLENFPTIIF